MNGCGNMHHSILVNVCRIAKTKMPNVLFMSQRGEAIQLADVNAFNAGKYPTSIHFRIDICDGSIWVTCGVYKKCESVREAADMVHLLHLRYFGNR